MYLCQYHKNVSCSCDAFFPVILAISWATVLLVPWRYSRSRLVLQQRNTSNQSIRPMCLSFHQHTYPITIQQLSANEVVIHVTIKKSFNLSCETLSVAVSARMMPIKVSNFVPLSCQLPTVITYSDRSSNKLATGFQILELHEVRHLCSLLPLSQLKMHSHGK